MSKRASTRINNLVPFETYLVYPHEKMVPLLKVLKPLRIFNDWYRLLILKTLILIVEENDLLEYSESYFYMVIDYVVFNHLKTKMTQLLPRVLRRDTEIFWKMYNEAKDWHMEQLNNNHEIEKVFRFK